MDGNKDALMSLLKPSSNLNFSLELSETYDNGVRVGVVEVKSLIEALVSDLKTGVTLL